MLRGALAGAVAGLIAAWAMEPFQAAWTNAGRQWERQRVLTREGAGRPRGAKGGPDDPAAMDLPARDGEAEEPATVRVASAIAEHAFEHELTEEERPVAGEAVHYGFGTFNGALCGALADVLPPIRAFNGMFFGAALWVVADEVMLWKLGLAKKPTEFRRRRTRTHSRHASSTASRSRPRAARSAGSSRDRLRPQRHCTERMARRPDRQRDPP